MSNLTPAQLQEDINRLSLESFEKSQELALLNEKEGAAKLELMRRLTENDGKPASGKLVDMYWLASKEGSRQAYLKAYLKGLGHLRTARILEQKSNTGIL